MHGLYTVWETWNIPLTHMTCHRRMICVYDFSIRDACLVYCLRDVKYLVPETCITTSASYTARKIETRDLYVVRDTTCILPTHKTFEIPGIGHVYTARDLPCSHIWVVYCKRYTLHLQCPRRLTRTQTHSMKPFYLVLFVLSVVLQVTCHSITEANQSNELSFMHVHRPYTLCLVHKELCKHD